jgi:hypothetical protein
MISKKMIDWLLISIAIFIISIVIGIFTVVLVYKKKKGTYKEPNYHVFYNIGIILLFIGLGFMIISLLLDYSFIVSIPLFTIGIVYLIIGLSHKDNLKKN